MRESKYYHTDSVYLRQCRRRRLEHNLYNIVTVVVSNRRCDAVLLHIRCRNSAVSSLSRSKSEIQPTSRLKGRNMWNYLEIYE